MKFLLVILLSLGSANLVLAHQHAVPTGVLCDSIKIDCAKKVSTVVDASTGRIWAAWAIKQHLYVNFTDNLGADFSTPIQVNTQAEKISTRGENRPKIAIDGVGNIYLSWVTPLAKRFTSNVRFSFLAANSQEATAPITVNNDGLLTGHSFNELSVTTSGNIFISWLDGRAKFTAKKQGKRLRTSELYLGYANFITGERQFTNRYIEKGTCVCCRIAMTLDERNLPVMMWRHVFGDNYRDHALTTMTEKTMPNIMQRVSFENWQVNGCPHQGPALLVTPSINKTQRIHMAWYNNAPDAKGLFYGYSDNQGKSMSDTYHFSQQNKPEHPAMLMVNDGKIQLVWREFDGQSFVIRTMRGTGNKLWSKAKVIAHHQGEVDYPYLIAIKGVIYLHWHRVGQPFKLIKL